MVGLYCGIMFDLDIAGNRIPNEELYNSEHCFVFGTIQ